MMPMILLTLLLLAVPVGAEDIVIFDKVAHRKDRDYMNYVCSIDSKVLGACNVTEIEMTPDPCLAKMEAAINDMEPFIMADWQYSMPDGPERKAKVRKLQRAEEVWATAKHDCLRKP